MHDHSRFQRDINDVTGVSLSLSLSLLLTKVTDAQYRKRFRASYNTIMPEELGLVVDLSGLKAWRPDVSMIMQRPEGMIRVDTDCNFQILTF